MIIDGVRVQVPGVRVITWMDGDPRVKHCRHHSHRTRSVTAVVLHTSRGVDAGVAHTLDSDHGWRLARYVASTERAVSWHLTVCHDGTVLQHADLLRTATWHAGHANGWSVGVELAQAPGDGRVTHAQLASTVAVCDAIAADLHVHRQLPVVSVGGVTVPARAAVPRWQPRSEGGLQERVYGVIGHRNLTRNRGVGDPGDTVMLALLDAGWQGVQA